MEWQVEFPQRHFNVVTSVGLTHLEVGLVFPPEVQGNSQTKHLCLKWQLCENPAVYLVESIILQIINT